jgi:hypothetical protein
VVAEVQLDRIEARLGEHARPGGKLLDDLVDARERDRGRAPISVKPRDGPTLRLPGRRPTAPADRAVEIAAPPVNHPAIRASRAQPPVMWIRGRTHAVARHRDVRDGGDRTPPAAMRRWNSINVSVTTLSGLMPSNVAAFTMRLRSAIGPSAPARTDRAAESTRSRIYSRSSYT